ncbi:MAG TPA: hypothetical protein VGL05_28685 [Kribbella sp.]
MKAYRVVWLSLCGVLGAAGTAMALTWSLLNIIMLVVLAALMGVVVAMVALADPDGPARLPGDRRRIVVRTAFLTVGGAVSFIGLGTLLGAPTAVLLVAIVVGGSPYTIRYCLRWLGDHGYLAGPPSPPAGPEPPGPESAVRPPSAASAPVVVTEPNPEAKVPLAPSALSDEALCLAWRTSFSALQRASSPAQRLRIVDERRAYLDEIERRSARGLAAWLASGPRAAGDPTRFVLGDGAAGRKHIHWDDLLHDTDK